jgi:zinc and cadmium transporter
MAEITFRAVLFTSSIACLVTSIGIYIIRRYEKWGIDNIAYFMSFAAGVLISVSIIHLIPKSFAMNYTAPSFLLVGFFCLYLINRFLNSFVCQAPQRVNYSLGLIPMLGIGFHSFLDGVIYSVAFNVSAFTGVLAATGMVLHELPEGIVTYLLLERSRFSKLRSTLYALLAAAFTTPLGALVSYPFISRVNNITLGALLAVSAGALVYVGASHLLPAVEKEHKRYTLISMFTGIIVAMIIVISM